MKRHLLAALLATALMALALPGSVAVAGGGNSAAARDCQENHAAYGFRNTGQCVRFFVQGGTPFQLGCESRGRDVHPTRGPARHRDNPRTRVELGQDRHRRSDRRVHALAPLCPSAHPPTFGQSSTPTASWAA